MKATRSTSIRFAFVLAFTLGIHAVMDARPADADDWLQFRHDGRHTAASQDPLPLPMTDIWTVRGFGTTTWHGRLFYVGPDGLRMAVYCADLRTGATIWKQHLRYSYSDFLTQMPLQHTPVSVTSDGVAIVQDNLPGTYSLHLGELGLAFPHRSVFFLTSPFGASMPQSYFRTFRASDGTAVSTLRPPAEAFPVLQVTLSDQLPGMDGPMAQFLPVRPPLLRSFTPVGPFLIRGSEVIATGIDGLLRWTPGAQADWLSVAHRRPPKPADIDRRDVHFGGYPPTSADDGIVLGGMSWIENWAYWGNGDKHFLAYFKGGKDVWHQDYPWALGISTVDDDVVLTGAGSNSATNNVMAHDTRTGKVRWVYLPDQLAPDGFASLERAFGSAIGKQGRLGAGEFVNPETQAIVQRWPTADPHPYFHHPGIAVSGGRAYAIVRQSVICFESKTGKLIWKSSFPEEFQTALACSLVLSPSHVLVSLEREKGHYTPTRFVSDRSGNIAAFRLTDGKLEWSQKLPGGGDLALSGGLMFLSDGSLHAFAPAERTYRMAVDSSRAEDYDPTTGLSREPLPQAPANRPNEGLKPPAATNPPAPQPAVADATVVRLCWGDPVDQMVKQLRERRAAAPGLPLLVSVDWLDPTRTSIRGGQQSWTPRDINAFTKLCEQIARIAEPEHLDLAPEVNVYLSRNTRRLESVRELVRTAAKAVKRASPNTKVLVSFNREVLARKYGKGSYLPFGQLAFANEKEQRAHLSLFEQVDEVGLTSIPQSGFNSPIEIPGDYLLGLKATLPEKPILLTRLAMECNGEDQASKFEQASYLRHLIQAAYWVNAELIAYPELSGSKPPLGNHNPRIALRIDSEERLALAYWRNTLAWKRVTRLSAEAANFELQLK